MVVVAEDRAHWDLARTFTARLIVARLDGCEPEHVDDLLDWWEQDTDRPWLKLGETVDRAVRPGFRRDVHGHGWAKGPEAAALRKTLLSLITANGFAPVPKQSGIPQLVGDIDDRIVSRF
jgi:hypothetical protein